MVIGVALLLLLLAEQDKVPMGADVEAFIMVDPIWWHSGKAESLGLDNTPGAAELNNLARLADACDAVFGVGGYDVTSGYRSTVVNLALAESNDAVSLTSLHLKGRAADLYVHGLDVDQAASMARSSGRFTEVITYSDGHLHVAIRS